MKLEELVLGDYVLEDLDRIAKQLIGFGSDYSFWRFKGTMGAGKTTLISALCQQWAVEDQVSSPTFSIVNEYRNADDLIIYHFDFYRIEQEEEVLDIGLEEYLETGDFCLMEWPEKIPSLILDQYLEIQIENISPEHRTIKAIKHG